MALTFAGRHAEALAAGGDGTAAPRGLRLPAIGLAELDAQLALLHQLTGNVEAAIACCDRGLALLSERGHGRNSGHSAPGRTPRAVSAGSAGTCT